MHSSLQVESEAIFSDPAKGCEVANALAIRARIALSFHLHFKEPRFERPVSFGQTEKRVECAFIPNTSRFQTRNGRESINITAEVEKAIVKSNISEGMALVSAMHIPAAVYVNDAGRRNHRRHGRDAAGKADLGPWQRIYYAEFAGRRKKQVIIKVMGE